MLAVCRLVPHAKDIEHRCTTLEFCRLAAMQFVEDVVHSLKLAALEVIPEVLDITKLGIDTTPSPCAIINVDQGDKEDLDVSGYPHINFNFVFLKSHFPPEQ